MSLTLWAVVFTGNCVAQDLPATDLWLAKIENGVPGQPARVNEAKGYNNQPHFSEDGSVVYYTREIPLDDDTAQTDIAAYSPQTTVTRVVVPLFPGNEDFAIDANGTYWTGNGSKLYQRNPSDGRWLLIADYSGSGVGKISRLTINLQSGYIAIVGEHL